MIKIQEHLNREDADFFLDDLALSLWNHFNQKLADNSDYQHHSLVKRLNRLIAQSNTPEYLRDYGNNNCETLGRQKIFFEFLQKDNHKKLKELIISRPEDLLLIRTEILTIIREADLFDIGARNISGHTSFGELLIKNLFIYKTYRNSKLCPNIIKSMGLQNARCPYCNSGRVTVIDISQEEDEEAVEAALLDIDHFYSKVKNPFFALSFYNLIPSCILCNSRFKGAKDFSLDSHTNPFHKSYNSNHKFITDGLDSIILHNSISKIVIQDVNIQDFNDRDLSITQRYKGIYLEKVNELVLEYLNNYDRFDDGEIGTLLISKLLKDVPMEEHLILTEDAGKMYRDILMQIDEQNHLSLRK